MKIITLSIFLLALAAAQANGQTNAQIEKELISSLKELEKYSTYGAGYNEEKLTETNDAFEKKLLKYTKTGATLAYRFGALGRLMHIATSDDGKFRVYSWDMENGGTMHDYARVYQYQGADGKVYSRGESETEDEEGGSGSFVTDVFTLAAKTGTVYIICSTSIGSTMDHYQSADLYRINGAAIEDKVKLIKTRSGLTSTLGFEYNFFSVADRKERPVRLISFDKTTNTLKIPVVVEDKEFPLGKVTDRKISYRFDGTYFVKVG